MSNDEIINEAIDKLKVLTKKDFHGYKNNIWDVIEKAIETSIESIPKPLTSGELLKLITNKAKKYRTEANESIKRNSHMNGLEGKIDISQDIIDALLVDFINSIGIGLGVDYALYTKDLIEVEPAWKKTGWSVIKGGFNDKK